MARVPRHFRDKLVSSRTGTNTLDTSGATEARAIAKMAGEFQQVAVGIYNKQKESTERSERASKRAEYTNKSAVAAQEIQKSFAENPEEGYATLTQKNQELKDEVLSTVKGGGLRNDIGADIDGLMAQQSVNNKKWEINRTSAMDQQFLVDVQQMNVDSAMQGITDDEFEIILSDDTFTEENYKRAWGPEEGVKNFRTAQDALFTARAMNLMEDGRFFDAQDFIQQREEPSEKTRKKVEKSFIKMQKGAVSRRFFETTSAASVDVVEAQEGVLMDEVTASQLEDRVLAVSGQAAAATDPEMQAVLYQYAEILGDVRDIKMENTLIRATGDTTVEAELQAEYERLYDKDDGKMTYNPQAFLTDFMKFQANVAKQGKAGKVSAKNYHTWMYYSKVALDGIAPKGEKIKKVKFDEDKGMKRRVKGFFKDFKGRSSAWKLDVLKEVYNRMPTDDLDMINEEAMEALFTRGKAFATLNELGYPVDIIDSKVVKTTAGNFNVVGFDQEGMPVLDVGTMNMER